MISILETRIYSGYSRYGDPTVAWFLLAAHEGHDGVHDAGQAREALARLGLGAQAGELEADGLVSWQVFLFAELLAELLRRAGHHAGRAIVETDKVAGRVNVAIPCDEAGSCFYAGELATELIGASRAGSGLEALRADLDRYLAYAWGRVLDANARMLMRSAQRRGLPTRWLDQDPFDEAPGERLVRFGLLHIGHGAHGRAFIGTMPRIQDMERLLRISNRAVLLPHLAASGIPVPPQDLEFPNKNMPGRAQRAAARLGYPVMLKSLFKQEFAHLQTVIRVYGPLYRPEQISIAFEQAAGEARNVWVEGHVPGDRYRFLVIGQQVCAVACRTPPAVTGDGHSTVGELIAARAGTATAHLSRAAWTNIAAGDVDVDLRIRLAGLTRAAVLPAGQRLELRAEGTPCNGGSCDDVTGSVSDAMKRLAERAAHGCGLHELAGVDMAIVDLAGAALPPNCVVLDVLPDPDLLTHAFPDSGVPRDVADMLVESLFPPGHVGRIPIVGITGTNGKTTTSRMIAHILRRQYRHVGLATTGGAFVNDEPIMSGDVAGVPGAATVLADERVEVAVLETARGGLLRIGSGFDYCDVGLCLNVTSDHLGLDGIVTLDQMAAVKSDVIRRTRGCAVLNADDPRVLAMRASTRAEQVILVSRDPDKPEVCEHRARGKRAVVIETVADREWIVGHEGDVRAAIMPVDDIPATFGGAASFNTDNAAFAVAAAWAMGLPLATIRDALASFGATCECNPGRFNVIDTLPFRVVIDYAHNTESLRLLCKASFALSRPKRSILLLRGVGDRTDEDIRAFAHVAAEERFDYYICSMRGKASTRVPALLRSALLEQGVADESILLIPDVEAGVEKALALADDGDLVVLLGGKRLDMIRRMVNELASR